MSSFGQRLIQANSIVDAEMAQDWLFTPMQEVLNGIPERDTTRAEGMVRAIILQPGTVIGSGYSLRTLHERATSQPTIWFMARGLLSDVRKFDRFAITGSAHNPDVATGTLVYEVSDGPIPVGFGRYRCDAIEIVVPLSEEESRHLSELEQIDTIPF